MKNLFYSCFSFAMVLFLLSASQVNAQTVVKTWGFESSLENWTSGDGNASISLSTDYASGGNQSVKLVGLSTESQINLQNDVFKDVQEGDIIQYKMWISSADLAATNGFQAFFQDGAGWSWHNSDWVAASSLTGDQWNNVNYTYPGIASPLQRIGFQQLDIDASSTVTIYLDDITITRTVLPVELVSFTANVTGNEVKLSWKTATELNNAGFEVQRSTDKTNFASVGFVKGNGTTTESHSYSYIDNINSGTFYYRLKQTDFSGSFEFSNVVEAKGQPTEFSLSQNYPNPFNPTTTIAFSLPIKSQVHLLLVDVLGNVVKEIASGSYEAGSHKVTLNASNLASGVYFYRLEAGSFVSVKKLMLMK